MTLSSDNYQPTKASPRVSVCIPVYNNSKLIKETIDSILNQTYKDFELIVIDDGSPDENTWRIISAYSYPVLPFRHNNIGECATRNACVEKARGEYIAFCDSDDLWHPDKLLEQVKALDSYPDTDYAFSYYDVIGKEKTRGQMRHYSDIFTELLTGYFLPPSTLMIKKQFFNKLGGYDPSYKVSGDWEFNLRMACAGKGICVKQPLMHYRKHPGSASANEEYKRTIYPANYKRICEHWLNNGKLDKLQAKITRHRLARKCYLVLSEIAYKKKDKKEAVDLMKKAHKLDPFNLIYITRLLRYFLS